MKSRLIQGDSLVLLKDFPSGTVDAVITDPPYCAGGVSPISRGINTAQKIQDADSPRKYPPMVGGSRDQRGQLAWMVLWLSECWRVAKDNAVLFLFSDWRQLPLFTDAVQAGGWIWRSLIVWDKTPKVRPNKGYFRHQAEYIIFATKDAWIPYTKECLPGVFSIAVTQQDKNHITAKPVSLIKRLLSVLTPGAVVLDPFMGGGAVPRACVETGHPCIGVEIQPESYQNALTFVNLPVTVNLFHVDHGPASNQSR